jgi:hypothetical protein
MNEEDEGADALPGGKKPGEIEVTPTSEKKSAG